MTDAVDRALAAVNPVSGSTVRDLTGPAARDTLLADLLGPRSDDSSTSGPGPVGEWRSRRRHLTPLLAAAAVATLLLVSGLWATAGDPEPSYGDVWVAAPEQASGVECPQTGVPELDSPARGAGVVDVRGTSTFCVHADLGEGSEGGTAWSALAAVDGPPTLRVTHLVEPVDPPAAADVLVLGCTSDAFAADVERPDAVPLSTHQVFGLAGRDVTGVQLLLPGGTTVTAALADGVWGLWWPAELGPVDSSRVRITTADGGRTVALEDVGLPDREEDGWFG